ncbi:uncharacterized protein LOC143138413 [Alosa pseudoharengus]|uniref:uncharacterized protein LOC143138413 n=1 Tax=Alosa pseudoharengus TaxID=34774 RepID=UPI003F888513
MLGQNPKKNHAMKCISGSRKSRFKLHTKFQETAETFTVLKCYQNMKLSELKCALELVAGIPMDLQRLSYLDEGDLIDQTSIGQNDIIPGTTLTMAIWPYNNWREVVQAAALGDMWKLKSVLSRRTALNGVGDEGSYWRSRHLSTALYICAHRGHLSALRFLLQRGADPKFQTPGGRGVLHVAASEGHVACLRELIQAEAPKDLQDQAGVTALEVALARGQSAAVHQLKLSKWEDRAQRLHLPSYLESAELFAHQHFDSHLRTWYSGSHAQRYDAELGGREARGCSRPKSDLGGTRRSTSPHHMVSPPTCHTSTPLRAVVTANNKGPQARKQVWGAHE